MFSATYTNYKIILNCSSASTAFVNFRLRASGADLSSSVYAYQTLNAENVTPVATRSTGQTSAWISYLDGVKAVSEHTVFEPFLANTKYVYSCALRNQTSPILLQTSSYINQASSYTGFTIFPSTGNFTGSVSVYGISN